MTIGVVAKIKVKAGQEAAFKDVFGALQAAVRANEPGCKQYDFFQSKKEPQVFVVMEQYASQADLDAHGKTPHFTAAGPKMFPLLDGMPVIEFSDKIS
jgi:quinol monooxygenase YgiN